MRRLYCICDAGQRSQSGILTVASLCLSCPLDPTLSLAPILSAALILSSWAPSEYGSRTLFTEASWCESTLPLFSGGVQPPCHVLLVFDLSWHRKPFILNKLFLFLSFDAHSIEAP